MSSFRKFIRLLGPGLLYAGAAVGVSHLVQSTRAGAGYGFELVWVLIVANLIKYPFFEFGTRYVASTGENLISGYARLGKWAIILYALLTIGTMFAIMAAITIVTAGLVGNVFHLNMDPVIISMIILIITTLVLLIGKYKILDNLIKWVIVILALSTLIAVIFALKDVSGFSNQHNFNWSKNADILFLIAFIGWMPAPIDVSVWQSMWGEAKSKKEGHQFTLKRALLDFRIGYIGTIFLAIGFLSLGALIMYGSGENLSASGVIFADQLIALYTQSIGQWAYYVISIAAIATMVSTTITCLDAYPRVLKQLTGYVIKHKKQHSNGFDKEYLLWILVTMAGAILLLSLLNNTMGFMVDLATTISFVTAPLLAFINYKVITHKIVPHRHQPGVLLKMYAITGIVFLSLFTLFYLVWRIY